MKIEHNDVHSLMPIIFINLNTIAKNSILVNNDNAVVFSSLQTLSIAMFLSQYAFLYFISF